MHACIYTCRHHQHTATCTHNACCKCACTATGLGSCTSFPAYNSVVTLKMAFWQLNMMQLYTPEVKAVEEGTSFTYFVISHISGHVLLERWMWDGGRCMFMVDLKGMLHEFGYHI